jgi:hypothetical protein
MAASSILAKSRAATIKPARAPLSTPVELPILSVNAHGSVDDDLVLREEHHRIISIVRLKAKRRSLLNCDVIKLKAPTIRDGNGGGPGRDD